MQSTLSHTYLHLLANLSLAMFNENYKEIPAHSGKFKMCRWSEKFRTLRMFSAFSYYGEHVSLITHCYEWSNWMN